MLSCIAMLFAVAYNLYASKCYKRRRKLQSSYDKTDYVGAFLSLSSICGQCVYQINLADTANFKAHLVQILFVIEM